MYPEFTPQPLTLNSQPSTLNSQLHILGLKYVVLAPGFEAGRIFSSLWWINLLLPMHTCIMWWPHTKELGRMSNAPYPPTPPLTLDKHGFADIGSQDSDPRGNSCAVRPW